VGRESVCIENSFQTYIVGLVVGVHFSDRAQLQFAARCILYIMDGQLLRSGGSNLSVKKVPEMSGFWKNPAFEMKLTGLQRTRKETSIKITRCARFTGFYPVPFNSILTTMSVPHMSTTRQQRGIIQAVQV
jgi:hypothetical protein